jgi:hypothetical protein
MKNITFALLLVPLLSQAGEVPAVQMAVIGDSTVTGAASNRHLKPYIDNLAGFFLDIPLKHPEAIARVRDSSALKQFNLEDPIKPPRRITYSQREYDEAQQEGYSALFGLKGGSELSRALDMPEHSFAYLLGRKLNIPADQILFVAQDGKKVNTITEQLERVMDGQSHLPPFILISYGLNDICHPNDVASVVADFKVRFKRTVLEQLTKLSSLPAAANGTTVFISAPLDATNLMNNDELMSQKIPFEGATRFGGEVTCKELRDKSWARQTAPGLIVRDMFIGECKGLRSDVSDPLARVNKVRELQTAQMEAWEEVIADLRSQNSSFRWIFATSIRDMKFESGDLANDCFHPSVRAHAKIANQFLSHELKGMNGL